MHSTYTPYRVFVSAVSTPTYDAPSNPPPPSLHRVPYLHILRNSRREQEVTEVEAMTSLSTEIIVPPSEDELRVRGARRRELDRLGEVGFLESFSDLEPREVKKGREIGGGGSGGVFCVDLLNEELEKRMMRFTGDDGLVMKTVLKVRGESRRFWKSFLCFLLFSFTGWALSLTIQPRAYTALACDPCKAQ